MEFPAKQTHPHAAMHSGLSAVAIGSVFLMAAVPALMLTLFIYATEYRGWSDSDRRIACYAGYAVVIAIDLLSWAGVWIGIRGAVVACRTGEPRVLCVVGAIMSFFAALAWIGCFVAWHSQSSIMLRQWHY